MAGIRFFTRASSGDIVLASYTGRKSSCWIWALTVSPREGRPLHIVSKRERRGQWHHYIPLLFGRSLVVSRQDFHRDPRHQVQS